MAHATEAAHVRRATAILRYVYSQSQLNSWHTQQKLLMFAAPAAAKSRTEVRPAAARQQQDRDNAETRKELESMMENV